MSINAIDNNVLLKEVIVEEHTKSGIIIDSKKQTPIYEIVSIGSQAKKQQLFEIGNRVVIKNTVGTNVYIDLTTVYKSVKWWEIDGIIN